MKISAILTRTPCTIAAAANLDEAMKLMEEFDIRHLPVVDDSGGLMGILSDRELLEATGWMPARIRARQQEDNWLQPPRTVGEIMTKAPVTIGPDACLSEAIAAILQNRIGSLPILEESVLIGIVTEMDLARVFTRACVEDKVRCELDPDVADVMTTDPRTLGPSAPLSAAADLISEGRLRHIPIVDGGMLVGILSDRDVRKAIGRGVKEETKVRDLMTTNALWVEPDSQLSVAAVFFSEGKIGALPVLNEGRLLGIFTLTNLLEHCQPIFGAPTEAEKSL